MLQKGGVEIRFTSIFFFCKKCISMSYITKLMHNSVMLKSPLSEHQNQAENLRTAGSGGCPPRLPETTPLSSTGPGIWCGYRPSWSLDGPLCSVCCGQACWCRCGVPACTEPPWSGSQASHRSYCRDSTLPQSTCQSVQQVPM